MACDVSLVAMFKVCVYMCLFVCVKSGVNMRVWVHIYCIIYSKCSNLDNCKFVFFLSNSSRMKMCFLFPQSVNWHESGSRLFPNPPLEAKVHWSKKCAKLAAHVNRKRILNFKYEYHQNIYKGGSRERFPDSLRSIRQCEFCVSGCVEIEKVMRECLDAF